MPIITNINDPRIWHYTTLRYTPASHTDENLFITEGEKVTLRILKSDFRIVSIFATEEYYEKYSDLINKKNISPDNQFIASKAIMEQIVGFKLHTGIMAMAHQPEYTPLEKLSNKIIVLNSIVSSENIGSIVRNSAAFGFDSILVDKESGSPYLRRAVRVSMGAVLSMKINFTDNLNHSLLELKKMNYKILGAELTNESQNLNNFIFPEKYALIFGSEGHGINQDILNICDKIIQIPITQQVDSLNVAASSAVILYESVRQKDFKFENS